MSRKLTVVIVTILLLSGVVHAEGITEHYRSPWLLKDLNDTSFFQELFNGAAINAHVIDGFEWSVFEAPLDPDSWGSGIRIAKIDDIRINHWIYKPERNARYPRWSPDRKWIYFYEESVKHEGSFLIKRIRIYGLDTNNPTTGKVDVIGRYNTIDSLEIHPDGDKLLVTGGGSIVLVNIETGRLTDVFYNKDGYAYQADYTDDYSKIIFSYCNDGGVTPFPEQDRKHGNFSIATINPDGTNLEVLDISKDVVATNPSMSYDGKIVFTWWHSYKKRWNGKILLHPEIIFYDPDSGEHKILFEKRAFSYANAQFVRGTNYITFELNHCNQYTP
mgnify:CR=1 FL=1